MSPTREVWAIFWKYRDARQDSLVLDPGLNQAGSSLYKISQDCPFAGYTVFQPDRVFTRMTIRRGKYYIGRCPIP